MENTISIILPIKSAKAIDFDTFLEKAIQSVRNQKEFVDELIIVHCDEDKLVNHLNSFDFTDLNVVLEPWTKEPNFSAPSKLGTTERYNAVTVVSFFSKDLIKCVPTKPLAPVTKIIVIIYRLTTLLYPFLTVPLQKFLNRRILINVQIQ